MEPSERKPTTERVTVDAYQSNISDYVIYLFHIATYEFARVHCRDKRVLDFGCGTGYGTHALASDCAQITGVDISAEAVGHAKAHYVAPNLTFDQIGLIEDEPLPFDDGSFEVVLSFQVIEHIEEVGTYLSEIRRVLAPGGVFVCATPDRTRRLFPRQRPWNEFHVHEYGPDELQRLLLGSFSEVEMRGMTAAPALIGHELKRIGRARLLTLPFTFPGAPEAWRRGGLRLLKRLQARAPSSGESQPDFDFGHEVVVIDEAADPSVIIVAIARL